VLKRVCLAVLIMLFVFSSASLAQTLERLANPAPDGDLISFQMTDGTVIVQGLEENDFWKLTPDITGSYLNGTWTQIATLPAGYVPYAFASAVLADGRLIIEGGEYNNGQFEFVNTGEIYDPVANTWTYVAPPAGWDFIGDSPSVVLPNGMYLVGQKFTEALAELDPATLTWTALASTGKSDFNAEEGWTLLSDGTVLTADVLNNPNSEKYNTTTQTWVTAGSTIADLQGPPSIYKIVYGNGLIYYPPGEIGPAILRPDGTVFATGATHMGATSGNTSIYTPALNSDDPGTWTPGPDFPDGDQAGDSFASLLPNGNVLVEGLSGDAYEFNGTTLTKGPYLNGSLMVLPTGEVLVAGSDLYESTGRPLPTWAPQIKKAPGNVTRGSTYKIYGQQFNGLSQANAFGDEFETSTNYPLVRITNAGTRHVFYAKTHDHSTMGVATGNAIVYTNFDVPTTAETGPSSLVVVANGIASKPVNITVH
jgi:hypothetical protein